MIWKPPKSLDMETLLSGCPQFQNWSYWLPVARILRFFPLVFGVGALGLPLASITIGFPVVIAVGACFVITFVCFCLCDRWHVLNPVERLVIADRSLLVKRIAGCDLFLREHVKSMKFVPASDDDYDELQRAGQLYEAMIQAKGRRVEVNCWLLITESDAKALSHWLNRANGNTVRSEAEQHTDV